MKVDAETIHENAPSVEEKLYQWEIERELHYTRKTAVYVSVPLTTGLRFVEWFGSTGRYLDKESREYQQALKAEVVLPNVQRAALFLELFRWRHMGLIIDPTSLDVPRWTQAEYLHFWTTVIQRHARRVIFLEGWQFSRGCTIEFETAQGSGIDCVNENLQPLSKSDGLKLIGAAITICDQLGVETEPLSQVRQRLAEGGPIRINGERKLYKDEVLDHLACTANVAQFVSFAAAPKVEQRYCRVLGYAPNYRFSSMKDAVQALLQSAPDGMVNIRSFKPHKSQGNPFEKNFNTIDAVVATIRRMADHGLYTIVNEVVDEHDGGVSGVCYRGQIEFAPDTTPRCVDDEDIETATLPFELGIRTLTSVYGFEPDLRGREGARVEFSIHPKPRGWNYGRTIIWQSEQLPAQELDLPIRWPNRFSWLLGDKAFGLTLAAALGFSVPRSIVYTTRLFPYVFGVPTGMREVWTRPCPKTKEPGYYPSARGWHDPYEILSGRILRHPDGTADDSVSPLASVLIQESVKAECSGRAISGPTDEVKVRGVIGEGDSFMVGDKAEEELPSSALEAVKETYIKLRSHLGRVGIEWVFDGSNVWLVQLSPARPLSNAVAPTERHNWVDFHFQAGGLEQFRRLVKTLQNTNKGVIVHGRLSPLSHVGEIAEIYNVPIRFES